MRKEGYMQEYREKNREKLRKYSREWKHDNKVWLKPQTKEYSRKYQQKVRKEHIDKIRKLLGDICVICGRKSNYVQYHEIHGKFHRSPSGNVGYNYMIRHITDFKCICSPCHKGVHFAMKHLKMTWERIVKVVEKKLA